MLPAVGYFCNIPSHQVKVKKREAERKAQEVELNNLESLIYKSRRDDVVKQNTPLLDKLNNVLKWVEGDGQSASLHDTKSKIEEVNNNVSFCNSFINFVKYCTEASDYRLGLEKAGFVPFEEALPTRGPTCHT